MYCVTHAISILGLLKKVVHFMCFWALKSKPSFLLKLIGGIFFMVVGSESIWLRTHHSFWNLIFLLTWIAAPFLMVQNVGFYPKTKRSKTPLFTCIFCFQIRGPLWFIQSLRTPTPNKFAFILIWHWSNHCPPLD